VKLASELEFIKNTIQKEKTYKLDDAISHDENLQYPTIYNCMYFIFHKTSLFIFMFLAMLNFYRFLFFSSVTRE
jgi:hypothetical protein